MNELLKLSCWLTPICPRLSSLMLGLATVPPKVSLSLHWMSMGTPWMIVSPFLIGMGSCYANKLRRFIGELNFLGDCISFMIWIILFEYSCWTTLLPPRLFLEPLLIYWLSFFELRKVSVITRLMSLNRERTANRGCSSVFSRKVLNSFFEFQITDYFLIRFN